MFEKDVETLTSMGAQITTAEIKQQPELWRDTLEIYKANLDAITAFLADARAMGEGRLSVVFTGAGTSDYVGDTVAPYLRHAGDVSLYDFKPIATTDIVSAPRDFLNPDEPTLLVSFARSGNSPESLAAVEIAGKFVKNVRFLNITCAPEGKLAVESADDPRALTLLIPRANDKGFAMTGSYSCMTLLSTLIFDTASLDEKAAWVEQIAKMGEEVVSREDEVAAFLAGDFNRVTYLGSGSFVGTIAVQQDCGPVFEGESFTFAGYDALPEGYLALPFIMVAQTVSLLNSVRVGNTPDTPSPTGTVNRVVKGVTIHPFEG